MTKSKAAKKDQAHDGGQGHTAQTPDLNEKHDDYLPANGPLGSGVYGDKTGKRGSRGGRK